MTTRIDCSEAGFNEFLLANPQLDGHADLIWQLHAVYWRNKRLGHPKAVGLLIQYARAWVDWLQCIRQSDEGRMT